MVRQETVSETRFELIRKTCESHLKHTKLINYLNFLLQNRVHSLAHSVATNFSQISQRNVSRATFSYQPVKSSFIGSADVTDILGDHITLAVFYLFFVFFSSMLVSTHLIMKGKLSCYRTKKV